MKMSSVKKKKNKPNKPAWKKAKRIILSIILSVVLIAGCATGVWYYQKKNQTKIDVYSVETLNCAEWWESDSQLSGTLVSDYVQEVTLDPGKKVKKIFVKEGDKVKEGDTLLKYNVEEQELNLKLQKLQIKSSTMEIEKMEKELTDLKNRKARSAVGGDSNLLLSAANLYPKNNAGILLAQSMEESNTVSTFSNTTGAEESNTTDTGNTDSDKEVLKTTISSLDDRAKSSGNGKKESSPYVFLMVKNESGDSALISGSVINDLQKKGLYGIFKEYESQESYDNSPDSPSRKILITPGTKFGEDISGKAKYHIQDLEELLVTVSSVKITPSKSTVTAGKSYNFKVKVTGKNVSKLSGTWSLSGNKSKNTVISNGSLWVDSEETAKKITIAVNVAGKKASMTVKVKKAANSGNSSGDDNTYIDDDTDDDPVIPSDDPSGDISVYEDLDTLIQEKQEEITQAKTDLNEAKIQYKEAKKEVDAATVKANFSGTVQVAYTKDALPTDDSAVIVLRADNGIYVKTQVSEMDLDAVKVGGTIACSSWETEEKYEAVIKEISDYPVSSEDTSGMGNPNSAYYPLIAYIENAEGLSPGQSVSITYSSQSLGEVSGSAIYLQKAYIRSDSNGSYVFKVGEKDRLEKQYIKTGKTLNGQYVEVLKGITEEDYISFPYGKKVKEGAKTKISENTENIIY